MKPTVSCVRFPMKPAFSYKVCQSLSKFGMYTCVSVLHTGCFIVFFSVKEGNQAFGILVEEHKRDWRGRGNLNPFQNGHF